MISVHDAIEDMLPDPKPRVFHDSNAGSWCYQLPGRKPVQAESWSAAWSAVHRQLWPPAPQPLISPAATERSWLARALLGSAR